jgi:hypothetical protein
MSDAIEVTADEARETPATPDDLEAAKRAFRNDEEPEWTVWLTVAGALILGLILMFLVTGQTKSAQAGDTVLNYPATWVEVDEAGTAFAAADRDTYYSYGPRVSVRQLDRSTLVPPSITGAPSTPESDLETAGANWLFQRQNDLVGYRIVEVMTTTVQGKPAVVVGSVYLLDPALGGGGLPALMRAEDTIVLNGDTFDIMSFSTDSTRWDQDAGVRDRLLSGWQLPELQNTSAE